MAEPETLFVEHESVRMRAITQGQGAPVMLIHGMPVSLEVWNATMPALAGEFQVVAMDLPGFGQSSHVALERLEDFAEWLARLLDHLGIEDAHMVGHSFGGLVALGFTLEYPQRVRSLVLADSTGLGPYERGPFQRDILAARTLEEARRFMERNFHDPGKLPDVAVEARLRYLDQPGVRDLLAKLGERRPAWEAFTSQHLDALTMPLLAMWGKEDRSLRQAHMDALRHLPNAQFWLLENCGHVPQVEAPEAFSKRLLEFLREVESA